MNTSTEALIAHLKLEIEKLRRALFGSRSERKARLLEQMELQLEELEAAATEDELAAYPAELAVALGLGKANTSNHLSCLRGCGLVVAEPEGRRVRYELADDRLAVALRTLADRASRLGAQAPLHVFDPNGRAH